MLSFDLLFFFFNLIVFITERTLLARFIELVLEGSLCGTMPSLFLIHVGLFKLNLILVKIYPCPRGEGGSNELTIKLFVLKLTSCCSIHTPICTNVNRNSRLLTFLALRNGTWFYSLNTITILS